MTENTTLSRPRRIERLVTGQRTSDGAGVKLTRVLSNDLHQRLDPFLMLDAFGSDQADDYIAGFPDHPHRGFETVTYMIAGRMRHRDSAGNEGLLENGGVQWMTAGRGVIHSELPEQEEGLMEGFQLWLNLPSTRKMQAPWYRDFKAPELPRYRSAQGAEVTVIAGQSQGTAGAVQREGTEPLYLDIHLPAGAQFEHLLPESHNAFIYVYRGQVHLDGQAVPIQKMAILANEPGCDGVRLHAGPDSRLLLLAGRPLREPIVQYGPFVMNTKQEIYQAVTDYQSGQLTR
jgi:redox-sensitive bicupin YhaK (pirin superfamily)